MPSPSPFRVGRRPGRSGQFGFNTGAAVIPGPPAPVEIPLCWFTQPVRLRLERPFTTASVSQPGYGTAFATAGAASDFPFTATLSSATAGDAQSLADWTVAYRGLALTRCPELTLDLMIRSTAEKVMLLRVEKNQRIKITGVPGEFPQGAAHLIVSGINNEMGVLKRRLRWTTRPVIGTAPGVSGPWFYLGASAWDGPDIILP